ncbi:MAG: hypothetical protein HDR02_06570 [Lachnospiraceae bacterium]|nr:hypothetical protein [Lachnospiraceae bacterium]
MQSKINMNGAVSQTEPVVCGNKSTKESRERGAVVVEAIISMTAFIFTMLIILSIADIAYTQSKMAVALNSAAKEISQYCYLYYKFQLDDVNADQSNGTERAQETVKNTMAGLGQMMDSFGEAGSSFDERNFDSAVNRLIEGADAANQTVSSLANDIAEDPKAFLIGMGKLAGREMTEAAKVYLGQIMAKAFMSKNLKSFAGDDPDAFLRRLHVVDGMDGLDFQYTSLMAYGSSNEIHLVCTYQVRVIQLLKTDFTFTFRQTAKTLAWGDGASLVTPRSIWTSMAPTARGKYIVGEEKEGYVYTSSGQGFDAYVNSGGKNEFVTITTIDPTSGSYQDVDGIRNRLSKNFDDMYAGVANLGSSVTVMGSGGEATVDSDPATRSYQIVLVLPEGTDAAYKSKVNEAISQLQAKYPGTALSVKVKEGYGSVPTKPTGSTDTESG